MYRTELSNSNPSIVLRKKSEKDLDLVCIINIPLK